MKVFDETKLVASELWPAHTQSGSQIHATVTLPTLNSGPWPNLRYLTFDDKTHFISAVAPFHAAHISLSAHL